MVYRTIAMAIQHKNQGVSRRHAWTTGTSYLALLLSPQSIHLSIHSSIYSLSPFMAVHIRSFVLLRNTLLLPESIQRTGNFQSPRSSQCPIGSKGCHSFQVMIHPLFETIQERRHTRVAVVAIPISVLQQPTVSNSLQNTGQGIGLCLADDLFQCRHINVSVAIGNRTLCTSSYLSLWRICIWLYVSLRRWLSEWQILVLHCRSCG